MKYLFIFSTFLAPFLVTAQPFQQLLKEANELYQTEQYHESSSAYEKAFKLEEASATQYYNAACSFALDSNSTKAIEHLYKAVNAGWTNVTHLKRDSDLASLHNETEWAAIVDKAQQNLDAYEKDFNQPLKRQLEHIYVKDQMLRQLWIEAENKFGKDSDEMNYFWKLMAQEDSANEAAVIAIINQYGWVGRSEVGGKANLALWLVIQHAALDLQEKYVLLLEESVKNGESGGSHLALLHDRILMRNGKPQKYGSQVISDPETGEDKLYDLEDPESVNARRKAVGLGPLEEYLNKMGVSSK